MCKYCEFDLMQEPFTEEEIYRGDLFLHEKDSDMYIERQCVELEFTEYYFYFLVTQTADKKNINDEIDFCPKCGRRLPVKE